MQLLLIDFDLWSQSLNHFYAMQICFSVQISLELIGKRCPFLKTKQTNKKTIACQFSLNCYSGASVSLKAGSSSSLVQAFIDIPSDLLTSRAMARWHRLSLSSPFPVLSGRATKSSFTTKRCRHLLPAKNEKDGVQSDQRYTYRSTCSVGTHMDPGTRVT